MTTLPSPQVTVPIVAMRAGTDYQTYVDLLVPGQAKISLLQVWTSRRLPLYATKGYFWLTLCAGRGPDPPGGKPLCRLLRLQV